MVSDGYPLKFSANNSKGEYIARGLKIAGCNVAMLDEFYGTKGVKKTMDGISEKGIDYLLLPRIGRLSTPFHTIPAIWSYLKKRKEKKGKNHIIIGMKFYPLYIIICLMAWFLGYTRSSLYHEWHVSLVKSKIKIFSEAWFKDITFGYFLNGIFPIGHFLENKAKKFNKPLMIVPVLAEYKRMPFSGKKRDGFAYCCGAAYLMRNRLILDSFKKLILSEGMSDLKLVLILIGKESELKDVANLINSLNLSNNVIMKSQISQSELAKIYDNAIGLIVPLDPHNVQDIARFSQKIAEYVASKRPIITSNVGEIPYYFKDNESAKIVPYNSEGYFQGMKALAEDSSLAYKIGLGGYDVGCQFFDYIKVGQHMKEFIEQL